MFGYSHSVDGVNGSIVAHFLITVIVFSLITVYLGFRIYKKKKYFTREWEKVRGPSKFGSSLSQEEQQELQDQKSGAKGGQK